jgi:hypothetical protein
MVDSSFFTDGPTNTGVEVAPAAPASFYADPAAAASSAAQAADSALAAAASAAAAALAAASAAASSAGKANIDSPTFTGIPAAPTPSNGDNSTRIATTAWVQANAVGAAPATAAPLMDSAAAVGTAIKYAREDHVHPSDTSRASVSYVNSQVASLAPVAYVDAQDATKAPTASPTFTGSPTAPTPTAGDHSTKLATTAFVATALTPFAPLASPALTGSPSAPTAAFGDKSTLVATTAFVAANAILARTSPITLYVSPSGSNSNDGLTPATSLQTLQYAANLAYSTYYTCNQGSIAIDGQGNTFQEFVQVFFPLNGGGTLLFKNFTWKPITSGYCLQFGDNALVGLTNINLSSAGVTTPAGFVVGHQMGVLDVNTGVQITPTVAISGDVFTTDGLTHFNINNGLTINAGTINGFIYRSLWAGASSIGKSSWNIQGAHVYNGSPTIGRFAWSTLCSSMVFSSTVTHTGTVICGSSLVNQNGVLQNLGAALPGGAPTPTTGGQYTTSQSA